MKAKSKAKTKNPLGRPTKYHPSMPARARKLILKNGIDIVGLATAFGTHRDTIFEWMHVHPDFSDAIKQARDQYASGLVENHLLRRASGYQYTETIRELGDDGKLHVVKKVKKEMAPDATSMIFWLKNRQPERWRDVHKVEASGSLTVNGNLAEDLAERIARLNATTSGEDDVK